MIDTPENLIPADVELVGIDGNAFSVMGEVIGGLRAAGNEASVIEAYQNDAMSGDYNHLLTVSMAYTA
jgi:hypothetical protein